MNDETKKFLKKNKMALIIVVVIILAVISSFVKAEEVPPGTQMRHSTAGITFCWPYDENHVTCVFAPTETFMTFEVEPAETEKEEKTGFELEA